MKPATYSSLQYYLCMVVLLLLLVGCRSTQAAVLPYVDLNQRSALPSVGDAEVSPMRLAVGAMLSPQGNIDSYRELAAYLGEKLGRPVEIVQRRTYAETNELIAQHSVDMAFVCTSAYIDGYDDFGMELLVAPEINGRSVYHSQIIVSTASPVSTLDELRGATFAFTDPMSFSGRVYPTFMLQEMGQRPEQFFSDTVFTYSHDRAIEAVAVGIVDAAAVDSLVLQYALEQDPVLSSKIRIIHTSPPFGIPPVVVPPGLSPHQKMQWQNILLDMNEDATGQTILSDLGIDRFVLIEDSAYDSARNLVARTVPLP